MKKLLPKSPTNPLGFTLVELLVVIAIISILSTIGLVVFSSVRGNARDAIRRSVVRTLATAIEAKKGSNGKYTFTTTNLQSEFPDDPNYAYQGNDPLGYPYCIYASTSIISGIPSPLTTTDYSTWSSSACPTTNANYTTLALAVGSGNLSTGNATSWTVCARLEAGSNVFCLSSLTR